ncbi:ArnT family glycosyltransferase [Massilia luteola]|uniref:ArnT family glycosyltransferase n=1 Tax=Massilia luteola TaxID=3081751 RepID=UPI002ACC3490|nr:glycosyltransferase family 39 protein [Massilia sp. Gc5]
MKRAYLGTMLALLPIVALVFYYFVSAPTNGDFWWYDSSRHAMNGVFLRDFLMEGGLRHPIQFASAYYEKYPGINIGFYPPFFYISSVPLLLVFGASHAVSQAAVVLYTLGLGVVVLLLCRRIMNDVSAASAAVCVMALAPIALWSRQVQLDVPALAIFVFTAYALLRHLETGKQGWLFIAATAMGLGVLTRVQGVFMAPVWLYFVFVRDYPHRPPIGRRVLATLLSGLIALPAVALAIYFARVNQALTMAMPGMPKLWTIDNWTWYAQQLPTQIGYPALAVLVIGLVAAVWLGVRGNASLEIRVTAVCGVCAWLFFTVVSNKDPRFNLPGVVFLFMLAVCAIAQIQVMAGRIILPLLALWLVVQLQMQPGVPYVRGFERAAAVVTAIAPPSSNVLISAHRDGNFIYDLRTQNARRDIGVRRADKLLVEINILRELGVHERNLKQQQILSLLDKQHIETVVFQSGYLTDLPSIQNLESLLEHSGNFVRVAIVPLEGKTNPSERQLLIYRRQRPDA